MPLKLVPRSPLPAHSFSPPRELDPIDALDPGSSTHSDDGYGIFGGNGASGDGLPPPRPPADFLLERDMRMYGAQPLVGGGGRGLVRCTKCSRTVLEWAAGEHARICSHVLDGTPLTSKKAKAGMGKKEESGKKRRASELTSSPPSPSHKRPRPLSFDDDDADDMPLMDRASLKGLKKSEIKKLLKEQERQAKRAAKEKERLEIAERKRKRANGPIDLEDRCGVINDKGLPCSRSLTCKTHTVGAKRAVLGRSSPWDVLVLAYQRKHNPNFKEPARRDGKPAASSASAAAAAALRSKDKKASAKKRGADDDRGLDDDVDGLREMDELLRAARIAGDRVRSTFDPRPSAAPVRPKSTAGSPAGLGAGHTNLFASQAVMDSVWRAASYEQMSMGDLLTEALRSRTVSRVTHAMPPNPLGVAPVGVTA